MTRTWLAAALLAGVPLCAPGAAEAHAMLEHASPGAGAVLSAPPKALSLTFSEALEPAFSAISVTDNAGRSVAAAPSAARGATMTLELKPLPPGRYRVIWHALSLDTHRTEGRFQFTIKP